MALKNYIYQGSTVVLVLLFGMAGFFKLFPHLMKDPDHDFVSIKLISLQVTCVLIRLEISVDLLRFHHYVK